MTAPPSVILLSTVHFRYDPRIVYRMGLSLAPHYRVHLLLPLAKPSTHVGMHCVPLPYFSALWWRVLLVHPLALWHCLRLRSRVVHIHDPELIPLAFVLKWLGKAIIYDVHENVRKQLRFKHSNNSALLAWLYRYFDRQAQRHFRIVLAEHAYLSTYAQAAKPPVTILNYPSLSFFNAFWPSKRPKNTAELTEKQPIEAQPVIFYIGQISLARGIDTLIEALVLLQRQEIRPVVRLYGGFEFDLHAEAELQQLASYALVKNQLRFMGKTDPKVAFEAASEAFVGLALLKPVGDFAESYPTKIFEYMAVGLPVVTSDFPLYRSVVGAAACGFCIHVTNAQALADALSWLLAHPAEAQQMGKRGRQAVEEHYQWSSQEAKLLELYRAILPN